LQAFDEIKKEFSLVEKYLRMKPVKAGFCWYKWLIFGRLIEQSMVALVVPIYPLCKEASISYLAKYPALTPPGMHSKRTF
jgi:hypothetical protein